MKNELTIKQFGNRKICIGGVGKLFYQDGFPVSMSIEQLRIIDVETSVLHVARECLQNGWNAKTVFNKLKADFEDDINGNKYDIDLLECFCNADLNVQDDMIFNYLFKGDKALAESVFLTSLKEFVNGK